MQRAGHEKWPPWRCRLFGGDQPREYDLNRVDSTISGAFPLLIPPPASLVPPLLSLAHISISISISLPLLLLYLTLLHGELEPTAVPLHPQPECVVRRQIQRRRKIPGANRHETAGI